MKLLSHPGAGWLIRRAQSSDLFDIEAIFLGCLEDFPWRRPAKQERLRLRQTLAATTVLAAVEPRAGAIGFLTLETQKGYVPHLFVQGDWRFCGVGAGLLEVARDVARRPLHLDVDRQNTQAKAAYEAMGWTTAAPAGGRRSDQIRMVGP